MKKERIVVAMSGGVDSSVAAALLVKQGYEVVGITMCFSCNPRAIEDARRVARKLGIKHYVVNLQKQLEELVINSFCSEYLSGRTPNPCIKCNQFIKFGELLKKAISLDAKFLATGHYSRVAKISSSKSLPVPQAGKIQKYILKKAKDSFKDQSYFLYRLNQNQLKHAFFPLGDYTKIQVREIAREFKLSVAEKAGSQEICFLPDNDYRSFLESRAGFKSNPGLVIDTSGKVLGKHKGIAYYTIGQREGLGIAWKYPLYITGINAKDNYIIVGAKEDALSREFIVKDVVFAVRQTKKRVAARVKIRYNHKEARAVLEIDKKRVKVIFKEPQFAITPGQSAVFYNKDLVLGGGIIEKVLS